MSLGLPGRVVPAAARAQVLLRRAESWATQLRHDHVGTEHLLLAMTEDSAGIAGAALTETESRQAVREYLTLHRATGTYLQGAAGR